MRAAGTDGVVLAALAPGAVIGVFYFGPQALLVLTTATVGCVAIEAILTRAVPGWCPVRPTGTLRIGLLLGMSLPPAAPAWLVLAGCAGAALIGRFVRAGIGFDPLHPALAGRVLLLAAFPGAMAAWRPPGGLFAAGTDAAGAVARELLVGGTTAAAHGVDLVDGLIGRVPGCVGETSVLALALGGAFLLWRRVITWHVPVSFVAVTAALGAAAHAIAPGRFPGAGFHLVYGGLLLGAVFIAADAVGSPATPRGKMLFGCGCGFLTWVLRCCGWYPEGVSFAILLMSMFTPLIDLYVRTAAESAPEPQP